MTFFDMDRKSHVQPKDVSLAGRLFDRFDQELEIAHKKPNIISFLRVNRLSFDPSFVSRNVVYQKEYTDSQPSVLKAAFNLMSDFADLGRSLREPKHDTDGLA